MYRVMNDFLAHMEVTENPVFQNKLYTILSKIPEIRVFHINMTGNYYTADIRLKHFSMEEADRIFRILEAEIFFSYASMYVRYNEGDRVRYRAATCAEDKKGVYADLIFS